MCAFVSCSDVSFDSVVCVEAEWCDGESVCVDSSVCFGDTCTDDKLLIDDDDKYSDSCKLDVCSRVCRRDAVLIMGGWDGAKCGEYFG